MFPGLTIVGLFACNTINPLAQAFMTPFAVTNRTNEPVLVTPVGAVGTEALRTTLPLLFDLGIYLPHFRDSDFVVPPGRTLRLVYDSDDVQFSEIVVTQRGVKRVIIVDPEPTKRQYTPPERRSFIITRFHDLSLASPDVIQAAEKFSPPILHIVALSSLIGMVTFTMAGRKIRKAKAAA